MWWSIESVLTERAFFCSGKAVDSSDRQRANFIAIADTMRPRLRVYCLVLSVSIPTLEARLHLRLSHPTLPDPETAIRVLKQMVRQYHPPRPQDAEGFDSTFTLSENGQSPNSKWGMEEVLEIIERIEAEGEKETGLRQTSSGAVTPFPHGRGRGSRGYRGRGYISTPAYRPIPTHRPYQPVQHTPYPPNRAAHQPTYGPTYGRFPDAGVGQYLNGPLDPRTSYSR